MKKIEVAKQLALVLSGRYVHSYAIVTKVRGMEWDIRTTNTVTPDLAAIVAAGGVLFRYNRSHCTIREAMEELSAVKKITPPLSCIPGFTQRCFGQACFEQPTPAPKA